MNLHRGKSFTLVLRILTSPVTVAYIITLAAIPFINPNFPQYQAKVTSSGLVEKRDGMINYFDINCDGKSEQFLSFINHQGKPTYKITDQDGLVTDQQEFEGDAFPVRCPLIFTDLNHDGDPEVIAFIQRSDSLFLTIIEYHQDMHKQMIADQFVTKLRNQEGKKDYNVSAGTFADLDGDSTDEVIFSVKAGYALIPRNDFIFDLATHQLIKSSYTGAVGAFNEVIELSDGKKGLLISEYAPGNLEDTLIEGVNDKAVRFRILDSRLQPLFTPVEFSGEYGSISCKSFAYKGRSLVAVLYNHRGRPKNNPLLQVYDIHGKRISSKELPSGTILKVYNFITSSKSKESLHVIDDSGLVTSFDDRLNVVASQQTPYSKCTSEQLFDLDQDGQNEKVFLYHNLQRIAISRDDLEQPVYVDLSHEGLFTDASLKRNSGKPDELFLQFTQKYFTVCYSANPWYHYRILAYLAVFLGLTGFMYFAQFLQRYRLKEKYRNQRNLTSLQLKLVKKQIDPHFLFNVITTLSYNLLNKESEEAYTGISRLAKFMRSSVDWGDKIARPLQEELEVTRTYLELYQKQHPGKFDFVIETADSVDVNQLVPVMILLNFVENAIKHGISTMSGVGKIDIRVYSDLKFIFLEIEDNGIGREAAKEAGTSGTGKGIGLMQQYLDLLNRLNDKKISFTIEDLADEQGKPTGTLVRIVLPANYNISPQ